MKYDEIFQILLNNNRKYSYSEFTRENTLNHKEKKSFRSSFCGEKSIRSQAKATHLSDIRNFFLFGACVEVRRRQYKRSNRGSKVAS